jgi:hypothetical protein
MTRPLGMRAACIAGTPELPITENVPGFGAEGAAEAPGAVTTGAEMQSPDWQPAPQWALVLPLYNCKHGS